LRQPACNKNLDRICSN